MSLCTYFIYIASIFHYQLVAWSKIKIFSFCFVGHCKAKHWAISCKVYFWKVLKNIQNIFHALYGKQHTVKDHIVGGRQKCNM